MKTLSKSKLLAFRQCPKRLWLELHQPDARDDSPATQAAFAAGHSVGTAAQRLYDPKARGVVLDVAQGMERLLEQTRTALAERRPIFEAGFVAGNDGEGVLALADVLLPVRRRGLPAWRMVEVKSSTRVKPYHQDDAAIQFHAARWTGLDLAEISLAVVDTRWTYAGDDDYSGLLVEHDLTEEVEAREPEVREWLRDAHRVAARRTAPRHATGDHCNDPFECGFAAFCQGAQDEAAGLQPARHPVQWLPRVQTRALKELLQDGRVREMVDVPDTLLNERQLRVKQHTLDERVFFDTAGAGRDLARHPLPAWFLDFETIAYAVPAWGATRPYEQVPFQFSMHKVLRSGRLLHDGFLDLGGTDPREAFALALIASATGTGPIYVFSGFENTCLKQLALHLPRLARQIEAVRARLVDLLPVAERHYYHPGQHGKWSIKKLLPAIDPTLRYDDLKGVQNGGDAQAAFDEAVQPGTSPARRAELHEQLWRYCRLDTFAMVRLWAFLSGNTGFGGDRP